MKNFSKAGLLIATLVIPALIFLFLQIFARNHYDLPYLNPELSSDGKILIEDADTVFHQVDAGKSAITDLSFTGKLNVITYLPKDCSDSCKLAFSQLQRVAALKAEIQDVQLVTLTLEQDDSTTFARELKSQGWEVKAEPANHLELFYEQELGIKNGMPDDASICALVDTKGFVRGYYQVTDPKEVDRLMAEIKILSYEGKTKE
ncbi:hypothetical protein [Dyadobacter sp. CY343]|uniref:hypothetical protein n=1 Tax=Dyadobacter sp. CY343 TaxID=2907299 RepID=UPI001F449265|nr:hypothetical protein [Dyadobacter sp. CY343]MCE7062807.1 hypothetical protein [Dyadobacter sp. CY343]